MPISAHNMHHLKLTGKSDTLKSKYTAAVVQHTSTALHHKSLNTFSYSYVVQVLWEVQTAGCARDMKVLYFEGGQIRMCTD
jgi:hypothetical protein